MRSERWQSLLDRIPPARRLQAIRGLIFSLCAAQALLLTTGPSVVVAQQPPARPNIVLILADDLGIGDTGVTGQNARAAAGLPSFATPNIDSIAQQGVRFNHMYAGAAVCSPSRATMLTGFSQVHVHFDRVDLTADMRPGELDKTFGQVLQEAGYQTGMFGKWHLGGVHGSVLATPSSLPTQKGFDTVYGPMVGDHRVFSHWQSNGTGSVAKVGTPLPEVPWPGPGPNREYGDNLVTARAVNFIRSQSAAAQPFLAYVALTEPHTTHAMVPQDHPYMDKPWSKAHRDYAGLMYYLDKHVGDVLHALEDPNNDGSTADSVADNTMVIFAGDNGVVWSDAFTGFSHEFFDSNGQYSYHKAMTYEGGVRVPFFVRWPGQVAAGAVNNSYVGSFADIMPTFAQIADEEAPLGVDGTSLLPDLLGGSPSERRDVMTFAAGEFGPDNPANWAVRVGDWKLQKRNATSLHPGTTYRLFNVATNPNETINYANPNNPQLYRPDILAALEAIGVAEGIGMEPLEPIEGKPNLKEFKNTYFTQYKTWAPQAGSGDFHAAANWAGGTQYWKPGYYEAYAWNTGPAKNWLATVVNTTGIDQEISLTQDADVFAIELRGDADDMTLAVQQGVKLTARNGIRIGAGGTLQLRGGEVNTIRDIEVKPGGRFEAAGLVNGQQQVIAGIPEFANLGLFEPRVVNGGLVVVEAGTLSAPLPGQLTIQGDYQQGSSGKLQIDLFGLGGVAGADYDQLTTTGTMQLSGTLEIAVAQPLAVSLGDSFQIFLADGGISGAFQLVTGPTLTQGLAWAVQYNANSALVKVVDEAVSGPLASLERWRAAFGLHAGGDRDLDGDTDGSDFLMWQRELGAQNNLASIPEPTGLALATGAALACWLSCRRDRPGATRPRQQRRLFRQRAEPFYRKGL